MYKTETSHGHTVGTCLQTIVTRFVLKIEAIKCKYFSCENKKTFDEIAFSFGFS